MKLTMCNSCDFKLSKNGSTLRHMGMKKNFHVIECEICGDYFLSRRKTSKYCSSSCHKAVHKNCKIELLFKKIEKRFKNDCCDLLTTLEGYKKNNNLEFVCPNGHKDVVKWNDWLKGGGCRYCDTNHEINFDIIKKSFENKGYSLISENCKNKHSILNVICPNGHKDKMSYNDWLNGKRCSFCTSNHKKSIEEVDAYLKKFNYTLISNTYKNYTTKLRMKCSNNHEFSMSFVDFRKGERCPKCKSGTTISNGERELANFIKKHFSNVIISDRSLVDGQEIDIYVPDKKIAIEYNGLYWHSEQQGKDKQYHLNKTLACNAKGVQLIQVFEDEWVHHKEVTKAVILSKFGIFERRFYARKCFVKTIDSKTKNDFLNEYHLQGSDNSSIKLGLFNNMELLAVMTFGKRTISGKKGINFELLRFCNKPGVQVVGGASKMLKFLTRNFDVPYIKTFADLRYSNGDFYKKIGFTLKHIAAPNYWYVLDGHRKHRVGYQKHKLKDKLATFNPKLTEYENVLNNGIDRVWDCGNFVYELFLK